jgi:hypothetical protein
MRRVGWHLDDVPQPFLTIRTIAFLILMSVVAGALMDGLLLGYDGTHHRSLVAPLVISAVLRQSARLPVACSGGPTRNHLGGVSGARQCQP